MGAFADRCYKAFEHRHGRPPSWGPSDYIALARIGKRLGQLADLAWSVYLRCQDPYFAGHKPRKMLADLDRFVPDPPRTPVAPQEPRSTCLGLYDKRTDRTLACANPPHPGSSLCLSCITEIRGWIAGGGSQNRPGYPL